MRQLTCNPRQSISIAGIGGLYLFAAGSFASVFLADLGMAVMLVAYILHFLFRPRYPKDPLLILSFLFAAYLVFQLVISTGRDPGSFALQFDRASHLFRLGFFTVLAPAFWLAQQIRRCHTILMLVLLSFLIRVFMKLETGDIAHFLNGGRAFLDMSPNSLGLFGAAAVLGTLVFAQRFLGRIHFSLGSILRIIAWCLVLLVAVAIFVFAQSRAVWVAAASVFTPVLLAQFIYSVRYKTIKNSQVAVILTVVVLAVTVMVLGPVKDIVSKRAVFETGTLARIANGDMSDLDMDAYGLRISWLRIGFEKWRERPLFGWGPYSVETIMEDFNRETGVPWGHLHNFYLQVSVQIGLVGFLFYAVQCLLLFQTGLKAHRNRWLDFETILFVLGLFGLFAIASLSGLPSKDHFGRNYIALVGGIAYAFRFSGRANPFDPLNDTRLN